ncbi:hypothetical protein, conserved [Eimeria brunetti]|uniref:Uncharacterized protein n=1 Tax=Eimeria brunetti TaxID=51314 RepID=U6LSM5_9EIME|nr:hypothetical protein, conserved [Eimeria brunetti]
MMEGAASTAPSRPRPCTSECGAGTGRLCLLQGVAAEAARTHIKECAASVVQRLVMAREEAKRCSASLQPSWVLQSKKVACEEAASRFVASTARACLAQVHAASPNREPVNCHPADVQSLDSPLRSQTASPSVGWGYCTELQPTEVPQEGLFKGPALAPLSPEVRKDSDVPQPTTICKNCEEASCGVAKLQHGDDKAAEGLDQLPEKGSASKGLPIGVHSTSLRDTLLSNKPVGTNYLGKFIFQGIVDGLSIAVPVHKAYLLKLCIESYFKSFQLCCQVPDSRAGRHCKNCPAKFGRFAPPSIYCVGLETSASCEARLKWVQSCTNAGLNNIGIMCNVGLISHIKDAWGGTVARLEDVQNAIMESVKGSKLLSLLKALKSNEAPKAESTCCSARTGDSSALT